MRRTLIRPKRWWSSDWKDRLMDSEINLLFPTTTTKKKHQADIIKFEAFL